MRATLKARAQGRAERLAGLRSQAAGLRLRANAGTLAVAAARDLSVILPRELGEVAVKALESGELARQWRDALDRARAAFPDAADEEIHVAALADILTWQMKAATRIAVDYTTRIEGDRRALEGRAAGIEATIAAESS